MDRVRPVNGSGVDRARRWGPALGLPVMLPQEPVRHPHPNLKKNILSFVNRQRRRQAPMAFRSQTLSTQSASVITCPVTSA